VHLAQPIVTPFQTGMPEIASYHAWALHLLASCLSYTSTHILTFL